MADPATLLDALAQSPAFAPLPAAAPRRASRVPPCWDHLTPNAHPPLAALLARSHSGRVWLCFPDSRSQEKAFSCLQSFLPSPLFFPQPEVAPVEGALPDPETAAERLATLQTLALPPAPAQTIVLSFQSLSSQVPRPEALRKAEFRLHVGQTLHRDTLLEQLQQQGYEIVPQVSERGQIAVRGGILDLFGFAHLQPLRIEFFGDEVESIRRFDLDAQTSVESLQECALHPLDPPEATCPLSELIAPEDLVVFSDAQTDDDPIPLPELTPPPHHHLLLLTGPAPGSSPSQPARTESFASACFETGLAPFHAGDLIVDEFKREQLFAQLAQWRNQGWKVFLFTQNEGDQQRLQEILPPVESDALLWCHGQLPGGFLCPSARVAVLTDVDILGRSTRPAHTRSRRLAESLQHAPIDFSEWNEGELVVHLEHGIARFEGLHEIPREGIPEQVLVLSFAHQAKMYVPLEQSGAVARYVGIGKKNPPLSELGDGKWARARKNAERSVFDYAARLLALHAERETCIGNATAPDTRWQKEFEAAFPYRETADQLTAIAATKADMESARPMDRLICGDVGFGKTEVAIRAAFKAVMGGKQVAMLVPTTVLAEQHFRNFRERMSAFPVRIEMLSRFRTPAQQRETLQGVREGSVDIVIGTHRLLSSQIEFRQLGLVIIDEEQRFGVLHKERLKERFRLIDQLTLSATPIPRTLYLSLMGARDMSTLETPPLNRIPVETLICPYDERLIRDAIQRELARGGQVFFLHNRVESIHRVRDRLQQLLPKARFLIGHGQMDEDELEEVMHAFVQGRADVLISTTIIESGIDIPNANTILIDRADRFGLADLYQLRGRVGRSNHKAYAYLLLPRNLLTQGEARRRLHAIKQYSSLGAGFKIALRDLEIRGAGNILGTQQSGHVIAIGFDLYCTLLKQAVAKHKGESLPGKADSQLRLDFVASREPDFLASPEGQKAPAFLPVAYITDSKARIAAYRALAEAASPEDLTQLRSQWSDRFGARLPEAAENLITLASIRRAAAARQISLVETKDSKVLLHRRGDFVLIGNRLPRLPADLPPSQRLNALLELLESL